MNKKLLKLIACLFILTYHLWIRTFNNSLEEYILRISFIGVDIFFFVSAYSLADKEIDYKSFILNRFKNIYLKFIFFSCIMAIYKKWSFSNFLKTILGMNLFIKGGGSFLWFLPAIMIVYLLYPFFIKWKNKHKILITFIIYILASVFITNFTTYKAIFILFNRIPIILIAYYLKHHPIHLNKLQEFILFMIGILFSYFFIYKNRVHYFITDSYYLFIIPLTLSVISLSKYIKENKFITEISNITLEVYAIQMIFGFKIANMIYSIVQIPLASNIITFTLVICIAYLFSVLSHKIIN